MASLTLTIGSITKQVSAADGPAAEILLAYAASIGANGSNEAKADAVLLALAGHMMHEARAQRRREIAAAAVVAAQDAIEAMTWG